MLAQKQKEFKAHVAISRFHSSNSYRYLADEPFAGVRAELGSQTHYIVDGGKDRVIVAALVTPASVMDKTPVLDLERWVRFHWHLHPSSAVADSKYGMVQNLE